MVADDTYERRNVDFTLQEEKNSTELEGDWELGNEENQYIHMIKFLLSNAKSKVSSHRHKSSKLHFRIWLK